MSVLLDYAIKIEANPTITAVSTDFLAKMCIVVKPNTTGVDGQLVEIFAPDEIAAHTDNTSVQQAFASGMSSVFLLTSSDLDLASVLDANVDKFYTLVISEDFTSSEATGALLGTYAGVVCYASVDQAFLDSWVVKPKNCGFYDANMKGALNAFAFILTTHTGKIWNDGQYIDGTGIATTVVQTLGEAESFFTARYSFYLRDKEIGDKLAFFSAGKVAISSHYVKRQMEIDVQNNEIRYIAVNQPKNTPTTIRAIEGYAELVFEQYRGAGMLLTATISISYEGEMFVLSGTMEFSLSIPVWRIKILTTEQTA